MSPTLCIHVRSLALHKGDTPERARHGAANRTVLLQSPGLPAHLHIPQWVRVGAALCCAAVAADLAMHEAVEPCLQVAACTLQATRTPKQHKQQQIIAERRNR